MLSAHTRVAVIGLLAVAATIAGRLLGARLARRREQAARLTAADDVSASMAHELNQPLTAMVASADAGLRFLDRPAPDLSRAGQAFRQIADDGHRAGELIAAIRARFRVHRQRSIRR